MERHGPVPRKEGAKSSTHTNIHTHTRTRKETKTKKINRKHFDFRSQTYQQCCIPIYIFLTSLKIHLIFFFFFFSLNVAVIFSHTFQTWSHSTRLQTTESHTHVSFPQRRTNTDAARVGRGLEALWRHPLLILGLCLKADPSLSNPKLVQFSIFFFVFLFFLAKVNLSNHRNQTSVPLEQLSNPIARINVGIVQFCKPQTWSWNSEHFLRFFRHKNNAIRLRWRSCFDILLNISGVVATNVAGKCSNVSLFCLKYSWKMTQHLIENMFGCKKHT